jgi:hypothetical protein
MNKYRITYKDCGEIITEYRKGGDVFEIQDWFWNSIISWQGDTYGIELVQITRVKN